MNIVQINITYRSGSTGKIMSDLSDVIKQYGGNSYMVSGYKNKEDQGIVDHIYYVDMADKYFEVRKDLLISRITGEMGYRHKNRSKAVVSWIQQKQPDVIHLHNIHGDWLHIKTLFDYIRQSNVPVVWTIHDCWPFTGRCSHFAVWGCEKWKTQCLKCKNKDIYPITYFFDKSEKMFIDKKSWFTGLNNVVLVTPSEWLARQVRQSYLGEYPVEVIQSGIDLNVFYPRKEKSRYLYTIADGKSIILGVASSWSERKGLRDFFELDKIIDHRKYQIVLVGLNKKQLRNLPKTILGISRTENQEELAVLYSQADCYLNCSILETMGMTTVEAMACGTPVVVYDKTAIPEAVAGNCGIILKNRKINELYHAVETVCKRKKKVSNDCRARVVDNYEKNFQFSKYIDLYHKLINPINS